MSQAVKIAIVLEGGAVSAVLTNGAPVQYAVVDYDCDGAAPGSTVAVPQVGGGTAEAYVDAPLSADSGFREWVEQAADRFGEID